MKKYFCLSAIFCLLLSVCVFSADAIYSQVEANAKGAKNTKWQQASNANASAIEARSLMGEMAVYYNLNAQDINKGKSVLLGSVLKGAATVTVTYVSGGATIPVTVITSMEPTLRTFGLLGSINVKSEVESAYEAAISNLQSLIWETSAAIARYRTSWETYSLVLSSHNSQCHGSGSSPSDSAHEIDPFITVTLNTGLPKFSCPDGSCGLTWTMPSSARTAHFAKCGTSDDPYNKTLKGCYDVFYTCNTTETARHQPKPCGLKRWKQTTHGWSKVACGSDYRTCSQNQQLHATVLGTNQISLCGPASSSSPVAAPTPTPTDGTPDCPDCTSHCSSPCLCTNSGTFDGSVSYHACGEHLTSVSGDHSYGTYTCGIHSGYKCQESSDHKTYISVCTQTDSNGNTCTNSSGYYECSQHTHTYPPPLVACGGASYTGCSVRVSSRTEHHVPSCSNCGSSYWTCSEYAYRHTDVKTCKRSGCGATLTPCQNGPNACVRPGKPSNWHWL